MKWLINYLGNAINMENIVSVVWIPVYIFHYNLHIIQFQLARQSPIYRINLFTIHIIHCAIDKSQEYIYEHRSPLAGAFCIIFISFGFIMVLSKIRI